jgi:hypothetical protein
MLPALIGPLASASHQHHTRPVSATGCVPSATESFWVSVKPVLMPPAPLMMPATVVS